MKVLEEYEVLFEMVIIDYNNEEMVKEVFEKGYWVGFIIYFDIKMGKERMVNVV